MAVSLKSIAEHLNVSTCIVSQVLNDHPRARSLRSETREKILAAARELGYSRNEMAAAMARKNSNVLAFVTGNMGAVEYTGRIQNGVLEAAGRYNYLVMLHRLNDSSPAETAQKILGWRAAGVIFHVVSLEDIKEITQVLEKNDIPWGTVNLSNPGGIGVTSDDFSGTENMVKLFAQNNRRHAAYLTSSGNEIGEFAVKRSSGYISGIKKYYPSHSETILNFSSGMPELLSQIRELKIDAIVCDSDRIAAELINAAVSAGFRVPEELSVAGFGNSVISEYTNPPLTTVAQDFEDMATHTVRQVVCVIEKCRAETEYNQFLPVTILQRGSTGGRCL